MEDLYIGQNEVFGVWVQEIMGGYRVLAVSRTGSDDAPSDGTTYATADIASLAAEKLLSA